MSKNHGVINVLKPPGLTSHDVVGMVRRVVGTKRVGHTGTLDPAAAGVLPICINQATRLVEYLQAGTKEYTAEITFGYETDTLDAEGKVLYTGESSHINLDNLRHALDNFRGEIEQTPPLYSAIKKDGKKLYELAREGAEDVEIPTRRVTISRLMVSRFVPGDESTLPRAMLRIECSGGTYIRSLIRDIGRALGTFATMTFLVRTRSGSFDLNEAHTLEQIQNDWQSTLIPITEVLSCCARTILVDDESVQALANGRQTKPLKIPSIDVQEYKSDAWEYKLRRTKVLQNGSSHDKVLLFNEARTIAALAIPAQLVREENVLTSLKAEKVFFLDRD